MKDWKKRGLPEDEPPTRSGKRGVMLELKGQSVFSESRGSHVCAGE